MIRKHRISCFRNFNFLVAMGLASSSLFIATQIVSASTCDGTCDPKQSGKQCTSDSDCKCCGTNCCKKENNVCKGKNLCCDKMYPYSQTRPNPSDHKLDAEFCSFCPSGQVYCAFDDGPFKSGSATSTNPNDYYPYGKTGYESTVAWPANFPHDAAKPYMGYCITPANKHPNGKDGKSVGKYFYDGISKASVVVVGECCDSGSNSHATPLHSGGTAPAWMYDSAVGDFISYSAWVKKYFTDLKQPTPSLMQINPYCDGQAW